MLQVWQPEPASTIFAWQYRLSEFLTRQDKDRAWFRLFVYFFEERKTIQRQYYHLRSDKYVTLIRNGSLFATILVKVWKKVSKSTTILWVVKVCDFEKKYPTSPPRPGPLSLSVVLSHRLRPTGGTVRRKQSCHFSCIWSVWVDMPHLAHHSSSSIFGQSSSQCQSCTPTITHTMLVRRHKTDWDLKSLQLGRPRRGCWGEGPEAGNFPHRVDIELGVTVRCNFFLQSQLFLGALPLTLWWSTTPRWW